VPLRRHETVTSSCWLPACSVDSGNLGDALKRASRYSRITNEAIVLQYREAREPTLRLTYSGIPRHSDEQQIEFCIIAMVRLSCLLTGRRFLPRHVSMMHVRSKRVSRFARSLGKNIDFGSTADEIDFPTGSAEWALVDADPHLNKILLKVCEESLDARKRNPAAFRTTVENTLSSLLPHGQAHADVVAKKLGMSERTLARRLAEEGVTFNEVLQCFLADDSVDARVRKRNVHHVNGVLAASELRRQIVELGMVPAPNPSPEQLQGFINAEMLRWGKVVQQAGLAGSE
jgi:hypothetical protein